VRYIVNRNLRFISFVDKQMDSPLADWSRSLDERFLVPCVNSLAHPGRDADDVLRNMLVLMGAVNFAEALCGSQDAAGQDPAGEKLTDMCVPIEAAVQRLAERIRRNNAQRNTICARISTLTKLANKAGWTGAMHSYGLHKPLSQEVIRMCEAAEIGVGPEFYQQNLPRAAKRALGWLRERF
jgi:hypothetical protein